MHRPASLLLLFLGTSLVSVAFSGGGFSRDYDLDAGDTNTCTLERLLPTYDGQCRIRSGMFESEKGSPMSPVLQFITPRTIGNDVLGMCEYLSRCHDRATSAFLSEELVTHSSVKLAFDALEPMLKITGRKELLPLIKNILENDQGNEYCDNAKAHKLAEKVVPDLLSAGDLEVPKPITDLFVSIITGLLQTGCKSQEESEESSSGNLRAPKEPISKSEDWSFYDDENVSPVIRRSIDMINEGLSKMNDREKNTLEATKQAFKWFVEEHKVDLNDVSDIPDVIRPMWDRMEATIPAERNPEPKKHIFGPLRWSENPHDVKNCFCPPIEISMAITALERLNDVGFDVGEIITSDNLFTSSNNAMAKVIEDTAPLNRPNDLDDIGLQIFNVEKGAKDIRGMFTSLIKQAHNLFDRMPTPEPGKEAEGFETAHLVKAGLVGLPLVQHVWLVVQNLAKCENSDVDCSETLFYSQKLKWIFVLNIAWAVWHELHVDMEGELGGEKAGLHKLNFALGLLTTAMSTQTNFEWDKESALLRQTGSESSVAHFIALYSVWNYAFVSLTLSPAFSWPMGTLAISFPIVESMTNHKRSDSGEPTSAYWINYRRDQLMFTIVAGLRDRTDAVEHVDKKDWDYVSPPDVEDDEALFSDVEDDETVSTPDVEDDETVSPPDVEDDETVPPPGR